MRTRIACLLGAIALAATVPVLAQTGAEQGRVSDSGRTVEGTIVSISGGSLILRSDQGVEQTFVLDNQSQVAPGLAAGDSVELSFGMLADGRRQALRVARQEEGLSASNQPQSSGTEESAGAADPSEGLPATASPWPAIGLLGLVALSASLSLRAFTRRRA